MPASSRRGDPPSSTPHLEILHEDNHVIAVFKPFGVPTQSDRTLDPSLLDMTRAWLKAAHAKPGNVYLGLVHRLDRPVGGIVVFAKTSKAAGRLSESFRERNARKLYHAVVDGVPEPDAATLEHYLGEAAGGGRARPAAGRVPVRSSVAAGFKRARLHYRTLVTRNDRALLEIELETGRKHQIRAQLAAIGHPIAGDRRYGGPALSPHHPIARARGIALLATLLEVPHPVRRDDTLVLALPERFDPLPGLLDA